MDAHEHGVGRLDIAFEGTEIAMEFHAPGADIVGFEHAADRAEDRAAVDAAVALLARPLDLFVLPDAAGCSVVRAMAELEGDEDHGEDVHAEDDGHDDHDNEAGHTEFHAAYALTCTDPTAITDVTFAYFAEFQNAQEVEVQVVTDNGATSFDVERDAPTLDLRGMF